MAEDIYTFYPTFREFLPVYMNVSRVWIGNGTTTGTDGMLYAEYANGSVVELGSVSLYATAVENGYTGTAKDWITMIMSVSNLVTGSEVSIAYKVSNSGTEHPDPTDQWSPTPSFEQGKFTWAKIDMTWIDGRTTTMYMAAYQGLDGQVETVNGETGNIILHGENLMIDGTSTKSIKDYIDESNIPETATNDEIDALFSMVFFSGAAIITGRRFVEGDSITYSIAPVTQNAPMPQNTSVTITPTDGNSAYFSFGNINYKISDIPTGETRKTYEYTISETAHTLNGVPASMTTYTVAITLIDAGDGTVNIEKSDNFNKLYFAYRYSAMGSITFEGTIQLNGRAMAAREFMVQIKEGDEVIANNLSTVSAAASGEAVAISFPPINYTLDDIGLHIYTVKETTLDGNGVTISKVVHTVRVQVLDEIRDAELEIVTDGSDKHVDFVNTYEASGTVTFVGNKSLVNRTFRNTDTYSVSVTGNGKLPVPTTVTPEFVVGEDDVDFEFSTIEYTLTDMRNAVSGYDDVKTFVYNITENANIPGVTPDGLVHTITVNVRDDKLGHLVVTPTYSDSNKVQFVGTYSATGSVIFYGEKILVNRKFVATDSMHVYIASTNSGKLPYVNNMNVLLPVGSSTATFNFVELIYDFNDLGGEANKTYNYIVTEDAVITGAVNDTNTHTIDVYIADNYDGTLTVTPTYSDGNKLSFISTYDATGYIALSGLKTIANRTFKNDDTLSIAITTNNGGKLPNPATISVPLTVGASTANFTFPQITYKVTDLGGLATKTFNYTITETVNMVGTTPDSLYDTIAVEVSDNADGTLSVTPTYTSGNHANLRNVYSADAYLSFAAKCVFTNGNMYNNPFTVKITQVTGNNSTAQAVSNVVLSSPVSLVANTGSEQNLSFSNIVHFVKNSLHDDTQNSYWFLIEEELPLVDANGIYNNIKYDTSKKWINVSVTDNYNGTLNVVKMPSPVSSLDATFTNEQLASLSAVNVWSGDHARLTSNEKNGFTYVVTGPNSYSETFTYDEMTSDTMTIDNLHIGEYTVTEINNIVENFTITTTYSVSGVPTNNITLTAGSNTLTVTNNVHKIEGTLSILQAWDGDSSLITAQQRNVIIYTVTGPKQKSTDANTFSRVFTYADMVNNNISITQLTPGIYTITESNNAVADIDCNVYYNNSSDNTIEITDGNTAVMTITNFYVLHKGSVKVTKQFSGIETLPVGFSIENSYNSVIFNYQNADNAATADGFIVPYEWTISNVPVHTEITFTEYNTSVTNYTLSNSTSITSDPVVWNETTLVEITNTYTLDTGYVRVYASFGGQTLDDSTAFNITNNYNSDVYTLSNAIYNPSAPGLEYQWNLLNVPVGTVITFTETGYESAGYIMTGSTTLDCYPIAKDTPSNVYFTNSYEPEGE